MNTSKKNIFHKKKKTLLVIATLISYNCASIQKTSNPPIIAQSEAEPQGIQEIDPNNPPTSGVWMTWEDAYALARYQREQRISCNKSILEERKNYEICSINLEQTTKLVQTNNSKVKNWFATYGLPLGILIGGIAGVATTIAIGANR